MSVVLEDPALSDENHRPAEMLYRIHLVISWHLTSCGTVALYGPFIYLFFWFHQKKKKKTIKSYGSAPGI